MPASLSNSSQLQGHFWNCVMGPHHSVRRGFIVYHTPRTNVINMHSQRFHQLTTLRAAPGCLVCVSCGWKSEIVWPAKASSPNRRQTEVFTGRKCVGFCPRDCAQGGLPQLANTPKSMCFLSLPLALTPAPLPHSNMTTWTVMSSRTSLEFGYLDVNSARITSSRDPPRPLRMRCTATLLSCTAIACCS